ncbi:MAG: alpha-amylase family glycosyl hydrolase [Promethearchaeota archaeon]
MHKNNPLNRPILWKKNPLLFEINSWPWLNYLSHKFKSKISLKNVPISIFDEKFANFDAIWLMGVWKRSPESKRIACSHTGLLNDFRMALDDFSIDDVVGSPYAIYEYTADPNLGGQEGLINFYKKLQSKNKKLILDFVPNHVSRDNIWRETHPEYFIQGSEIDLQINPTTFFKANDKVFAHGKDPYFTAWTDTLQVNAFSKEYRKQVIHTIKQIANTCDGIRCDMAMLLTNSIFQKTWGKFAGAPLEREFWVEVIGEVKKFKHGFLFIAEVYWDMEWELIQQGFDYCYDKRLYERLLHDTIDNIKGHLRAEMKYQNHLVRFIENHDEERALPCFGAKKSVSAGMIALTLPGCRLLHYGQNLGFLKKLPVQLGRYPPETPNKKIQKIYENFFRIIKEEIPFDGTWKLIDIDFQPIIYSWYKKSIYSIIFCNYSDNACDEIILIEKIITKNLTTNNILVKMIFSSIDPEKIDDRVIFENNSLHFRLNPWEFLILKVKI